MAVELKRIICIPDVSTKKDYNVFDTEFAKLLSDLHLEDSVERFWTLDGLAVWLDCNSVQFI